MAKSSPDTLTNLSPDQLHPSQIDESDWSDEVLMGNRVCALASIVVVLPLLGAGLLTVAALERWRAWRGGDRDA